METVLRALLLYLLLTMIFRVSGKRSLAQITGFDFVLLLVIGEAAQQALIGQDYSITTALIAIVTLIGIDIGLSLIKERSPRIERWLDDVPVIVVENGELLRDRASIERIDEDDVLAAARNLHGLERLDQIKYAVLERNGSLSIVPRRPDEAA